MPSVGDVVLKGGNVQKATCADGRVIKEGIRRTVQRESGFYDIRALSARKREIAGRQSAALNDVEYVRPDGPSGLRLYGLSAAHIDKGVRVVRAGSDEPLTGRYERSGNPGDAH